MSAPYPSVAAPLAALGDLAPAFALLTQLGDYWFYAVVLGGGYLLGERTPLLGRGLDRNAFAWLLGLTVGAVALVLAAKSLFAVPRPPGAGRPVAVETVPGFLREVYHWAATAAGYGFPSGHALGTTVVWGGMAWIYDGESRPRRLAIAAGVVAGVSLSRLVLGVHYPIDVVAGVAIGLCYLAAALAVARTPERVFAVAGGLALAAVAVVGLTVEAALLVGFALGGGLAWQTLGERGGTARAPARSVVAVGLGGTGLALAAAVLAATGSVDALAAGIAGASALPLLFAVPPGLDALAEKSSQGAGEA
jgi:membrane-associated phospholipid phosphatase